VTGVQTCALPISAPLARFIPLATLAAVLFVVAWNMGEWHEIGSILRLAKADIAVWAVTFLLTVVADLTVAVGVGMALAALLYIYRIAETTTVVPVTEEYLRDGKRTSCRTRKFLRMSRSFASMDRFCLGRRKNWRMPLGISADYPLLSSCVSAT
jgi:MFS superfamily sulfate permease-like transporter